MYITIIFKHFFSETALPIKPKFYVEPPCEGGTKVYINGLGHMTNLAVMPIYGKNLKNLHLQNQKSYDLETRHVSLGAQALQKSNRKAMNKNWSNQKANAALKTKTGNK